MDEAKIIELEKRVSLLEGWKESHQSLVKSIKEDVNDLKNRVTALDQKVDRFREELHDEIQAVDRKIDEKFSYLDQKIDRFREEVDKKIFALDQKITRFFMWVIGIQFGIFITIILMLLKK